MNPRPEFFAVALVLERSTKLNELQSRGLVRRLLKDAGLSPETVTAHQLGAIGRRLLPAALEKQGIEDAAAVLREWESVCREEAGKAKERDRNKVSNSVEAVFSRMGLGD